MKGPLLLIACAFTFAFAIGIGIDDWGVDGDEVWSVRIEDDEDDNNEFDASGTQRKDFFVALEPNRDGVKWIEQYLLTRASNPDSHMYGDYLKPEDVDEIIRPSHTLQTIQDLRDMNIHCFEHASAVLWCRSDEFTLHHHFSNGVPNHLQDRVNFIERHDERDEFDMNAYLMTVAGKHRSDWFNDVLYEKANIDPSVSDGYITREVMLRTYMNGQSGIVNRPESGTPSRTSVGAIEFLNQEGFSQSDMMMVQNHSCTANNPVAKEHILGWDDPLADGESELDMAVIWQAAAGADLWYQDYNGWIFGWAADMFKREKRPQVVSLSWGWNENSQCVTIVKYCNDSRVYVDRTNIELMKLAATGMTILVASGDAGSPGRTNEGCDPSHPPMTPVFPGSSPWVLSVGATYLKQSNTNDANYQCPVCNYLTCGNLTSHGYQEGVTTWRMTGWTSGSGFSNYSATPMWQMNEVNEYLSSPVQMPEARYFNRSGRAYPDIAVYGHNCAMYTKAFGWQGGDGTSCSAPLLAGIIAYLNDYQQSHNRPVLGFVNPLIYKMRREDPSTFNDISEGDSACTEMTCCENRNFGFLPAKGAWDPLSGVGSPRVSEMMNYLDSHVNYQY